MFNDLFKSLRATLYDRTASPLFGAFLVSWLLWNWKLIVVLLSGMAVADKFEYIEGTIYSDWLRGALLLAVAPGTMACLFLFVYPYPAKYVYRFWRNRQRELKEIRQQIEDATPLTIEESRRIRQQVTSIQLEYDNELRRSAEEQERLKQALTEEQDRVQSLDKQLETEKSKPVSTAPVEQVADEEISSVLRHQAYRLCFYPTRGGRKSKAMMFGPNGRILQGQNDHEHSWRIENGRLEFLRKDGKVHSRFHFHPTSKIFTHTNEEDTLSTKGQYLVPEGDGSDQPSLAAARRPVKGKSVDS